MQTSCKQTTRYQSRIIKDLEAAPTIGPYHWSEFELDVLRKYYNVKHPRDIARILGKSRGAIINKACALGLSLKPKGRHNGLPNGKA